MPNGAPIFGRLRASLAGFGRPRDDGLERQRLRARTLVAMGELTLALEIYDRLLARPPADPALLVERGFARLDLGDEQGADADAEAALAMAPEFGRAFQLRACLCEARNQTTQALVELGRAIEIDPTDNAAYVRRASLHFNAGRFDFALDDISHAIAAASGVADHYGFKGLILLGLEQPDLALAAFERAIRLDPGCAYALWRRGDLKEAQGDLAGGAADKAEALRLDPDIEP